VPKVKDNQSFSFREDEAYDQEQSGNQNNEIPHSDHDDIKFPADLRVAKREVHRLPGEASG